MHALYYIAIGMVITFVLVYVFLMALASGLAGRSPILLMPFQVLLVGSWAQRFLMLAVLFLIFVSGHFIYNHVQLIVH